MAGQISLSSLCTIDFHPDLHYHSIIFTILATFIYTLIEFISILNRILMISCPIKVLKTTFWLQLMLHTSLHLYMVKENVCGLKTFPVISDFLS